MNNEEYKAIVEIKKDIQANKQVKSEYIMVRKKSLNKLISLIEELEKDNEKKTSFIGSTGKINEYFEYLKRSKI